MKGKNISVWLFLLVLFLFFFLGMFLPDKSFSVSENRYLAQKPDFNMNKFLDGSFGSEYETYLSDQFPVRDKFVAAKTNMERLLFATDVNNVYFAKDNYYIERFDPEDLFTEQLEKNLGFLSQAAGQFSEKLGADRVKIMLIPSASQILREKLPAFASPVDQSLIIKRLREMVGEPSAVLSVEQELLAHRKEAIYYKTDHHWTSLGAYYAYRLYGNAAGFVPWTEKQFQKEEAARDFLGTIEAKVKVGMEPDSITLYLPKEEQKIQVFYDGQSAAFDTLYSKKQLEGKDKYAVFLDGNHGLTKIVNETIKAMPTKEDLKSQSGRGRRLLIIKDSYAHSFAPFAVNHFEEVHMVDLRYFNMKLSEYAKSQKITDIVIMYQIPGFAKDTNIFKMVR